MESDISQLQDIKLIEEFRAKRECIFSELRKIIVGQETIISQILAAILARGHCLIIGVPGLAKTLIIKTIAETFHLKFSRIQFTPDLMPADIIGTEFIEDFEVSKKMSFVKGPIFANIILADEINRTPPKTQAALLEVMQEQQITVAGTTYQVDKPFFVLATQNPIEQEGTYPLPEAQQDRFMFCLNIDYPSQEEEIQIIESTTARLDYTITPVMSADEILAAQRAVRNIPVSRHVVEYATQLARSSRPGSDNASSFIRDYVTWGAGPRAAQYLILGVKAMAVLSGKLNISCNDIKSIAAPVMRHRIFTNFNADADSVSVEDVIKHLVQTVPEPSS
jgi:MoxR-like ATPase